MNLTPWILGKAWNFAPKILDFLIVFLILKIVYNQLVDDDNWIDLLLGNWLFIRMTALGCSHPSLDKAIFICVPSWRADLLGVRSPDQDGSAAICAVSEKDGSPKWTYSLSRYDSKGYNLVAISARESQLVGGSTNLEHEKNWRNLEWLLSGCILAREIQKSHLEMMFLLKPSFVVVFHGFPHISLWISHCFSSQAPSIVGDTVYFSDLAGSSYAISLEDAILWWIQLDDLTRKPRCFFSLQSTECHTVFLG